MLKFLIRINRETGKRGAQKEWALDASCQIEAQRNWLIDRKPCNPQRTSDLSPSNSRFYV